MAKKLKALAQTETEGLSATIRESANQIWLAGLGAFAKAQAEGGKVFEALVSEGQRIQEQTKSVADERISDVRNRTVGAWDKLEQVFEDRVARALKSLNVPTHKDIEALSKRVAELTAAAEKLSGKAPAAGAKRARKTKA